MVDTSILMKSLETYFESNYILLTLIIFLLIWKLIWYGIALYKTIENKQKIWFVVLFVSAFVLNDLGLLPILYILLNKYRRPNSKSKSNFNDTSKGTKNKKLKPLIKKK